MATRLTRVQKAVLLGLMPIIILAGGAVAAELLARQRGLIIDPAALTPSPLAGPGQKAHSDARCYRPPPTLGYEAVPNRCFRNAVGMLGDEPDQRPPGAYRVLVLGDSIAHQDLWVKDMVSALSHGLPGRKVQYFNAGVPGYDTCHELRVLEERGLKLEPDLVLVQFCINDFMVAANVLPTGDDRVRVMVGASAWEYPGWVLRSHLLTWGLTRLREADVQRMRRMDKTAVVRSCLARMQRLTRSRGARLMVAVFPALVDGDARLTSSPKDSYFSLERRIKGLLVGLGIPHLELRGSFAGRPSLQTYRVHERDVWHPNVPGQKIIGEALAAEILRAGLAGGGGRAGQTD